MSGVTALDQAGEKFIAGWEGGQSSDGMYRAYWDSYGNAWTIGVGETHFDGGPVREGMVWTPEQAWADLHDTFARDYAPSINALGVELTQNQFNACGDYEWNCGAGALALYGVADYIKREDWDGAAQAMLKPDTSGGVLVADLVRRRKADSALLLTPEPKPLDPHHYLWFEAVERTVKGDHKVSERAVVTEYDEKRQHAHLHPARLHELEQFASELAYRLSVVMDAEPAGNEKYQRRWRRSQLHGRAAGRQYVA